MSLINSIGSLNQPPIKKKNENKLKSNSTSKVPKDFLNMSEANEGEPQVGGTTEPSSEIEMGQFVAELETKGNVLKAHPSIQSYMNYKMVLEKTFKTIVGKAFSLEKVITQDKGQLSQKEFYLINVVREEMSSLLKLIQSDQQENIAIIKQVIKINGLMVNYLA